MENTNATQATQFLLSDLVQRIEKLALVNLAYQHILQANNLAPDGTEMARLQSMPEFESLRQQCTELRRRAVEAVALQDFGQAFGSIGAMLGLVDRD